jgi:chromosomal replication initiator protein
MVINTVSKITGISVDDIMSRRRHKPIAKARQIAYYMMKRHCQHLSYDRIAYSINRTDHTTIMHGCAVIEDLMNKDNVVRRQVDAISKLIEGAKK